MKMKNKLPEDAEKKGISRRDLLSGAGKIAAGATGMVAVSALGMNVLNKAHAENITFPWGYKKIDPDRAGKIAYENWYENYCCYGAASGILLPLQEDIGEPYTFFPLEATIWGHGGAVGWGTLCGSLNGAGIATALVAGEEGEYIINDVIAWYTKTKLPIYKPSNPRTHISQVNKSSSALCHISVGKWMRKEKVTFHSPRRWERCARITADVTIKTVRLLNDLVDGKYKISRRTQLDMYQMPTENTCIQCHGNKIPKVAKLT
jgi:hypothetical protein